MFYLRLKTFQYRKNLYISRLPVSVKTNNYSCKWTAGSYLNCDFNTQFGGNTLLFVLGILGQG